MKIEINGKEVQLEFTYRSFKLMEDFDLSELETVEHKPFKLIGITENLLYGALNNSKLKVYQPNEVSQYIEELINSGESIGELMENLMKLLEDSKFFKSLQAKTNEETMK